MKPSASSRAQIAVTVLAVVLAAQAGTFIVAAQTGTTTIVTVVSEDGTEKKVSGAVFQQFRSFSSGRGGVYNNLDYLLVTAAVVPPKGVTLKPKEVQWARIARVEWGKPTKGAPGGSGDGSVPPTPAQVTYTDGKAEQVFLWQGEGSPLGAIHMRVKGVMRVQGQDVDVTVDGPFKSITITR